MRVLRVRPVLCSHTTTSDRGTRCPPASFDGVVMWVTGSTALGRPINAIHVSVALTLWLRLLLRLTRVTPQTFTHKLEVKREASTSSPASSQPTEFDSGEYKYHSQCLGLPKYRFAASTRRRMTCGGSALDPIQSIPATCTDGETHTFQAP